MDNPNTIEEEGGLEARYQAHVQAIILSRVRMVAIIAIVMYMAFCALDAIAYPSHFVFFFNIRLFCSVLYLAVFLVTFSERSSPWAVWLSDIIGVSAGLGVILMIFASDGSLSHYYEGLTVIILGMGLMNFALEKHNIISFIILAFFYNLAVFTNSAPVNTLSVVSANLFMLCTAFFVVFMDRMYSTQHREIFFQQEKLEGLFKTDDLTHLHNRRYFFEMLAHKIETSERMKTSFYLIVFDVDHLKDINDRWGRSFGDLVLTKIVDIVSKNIRSRDCLGRFGGDQFILFLDTAESGVLMNRLTKISQGVIAMNLKKDNQSVLISLSIGAAKFIPQQQMTKDQLIQKADQQLLMVKNTNRGQIGVAE